VTCLDIHLDGQQAAPPVAASKIFNLEEHKRMLELGLHLLDDDSSKLEYEKLSNAEFE
jgi:hypothetical protein